ncbi:MAG: CHAT domain-containing protein [Desulfobacterales bacterium]|nr:CHAT domain-containing protein [Desulfobacterales bacterium]
MKNKTLCLEAIRVENLLRVGIRKPNDTLAYYEEKTVSIDRIEVRSHEIAEILNQITKQGFQQPDAMTRLRQTGTFLCDELLTSKITEYIISTDAEYMILKIDDRLVHIPWELIYIGDEFLCRRFNMGRTVNAHQSSFKTGARNISKPLNMWILSNPEGNLASADKEGKQICDIIDHNNMEQEDTVIYAGRVSRTGITRDKIRETIRNYDIVHYAGHAEHNMHNPGKSGWKTAQGNFTADDISEMVGGKMPCFVFSNACQSARTGEWKENDFSLVNAFLRAGVMHYIGTFWKIMDEPGSRFALEFYKNMLAGRTVGESVRLSRQVLTDEHGQDSVDWASYVLYGDPTDRYIDFAEKTGEITHQVNHHSARDEKAGVKQRSGNGENASVNIKSSEKNGELKKMGKVHTVIIGMLCAVLIIGASLLYGPGSIEQHREPDPEIVKILYEQAEKKQKRISQLYKELEKSATVSGIFEQPSDGWTSAPLFMAMNYDSQISFSHSAKENLIAHTIQSRIIKKYPRIRILHRKSLDKILEELIREKPEKLELQIPQIILFLETDISESRSHVLMQLVSKKTGEVVDVFIETIDNREPVLAQGKKISENLVSKLAILYPLRGLISEVAGKEITLNIGNEQGVRVNQVFKVADKEVTLKVVSVALKSCKARVEKGEPVLKKGLRVLP